MDPKNKIATIDVNLLTFEPIDWQSRFLDEHHNCPLCGTQLLLTNVTHFVDQRVNEEAYCEPCNIRIRQQQYELQ